MRIREQEEEGGGRKTPGRDLVEGGKEEKQKKKKNLKKRQEKNLKKGKQESKYIFFPFKQQGLRQEDSLGKESARALSSISLYAYRLEL